jgi:aminoglycoside phosphotransferase (APT) family kinase protein
VNLAGVRDFLVARGERVGPVLDATLLAGGRSNLTYRLDDGARSWVLRMPPAAGRTPSAHDVARELTVTRALEPSGFPVPRAVGLYEGPGGPFTVVAYVPGVTVRAATDLAGWDDATVTACVDGLIGTLAALHGIDHRAAGLAALGRPGNYAERQLRRWSGQWELVSTGDDAGPLAARLAELLPAQSGTCVVHGDFRIDNTILDPADPAVVRAVVDWELATIGDPVADIAVTCAYRHPALDAVLGLTAAWTSPRLPAVPELAARYEKASGRSLPHWEFHLGLAYYKLAVIAAGIAHRHRAAGHPGVSPAAAAVPEFLAAGLREVA